jgi:uncharacterized membrane protein (UPF0127 family)
MISINGKTFPAEYMETLEDLQRGMMGRDSLDGCMVFKVGHGYHQFWMKGCKIPLDIVFVLKNKITKIHPNCPIEDPHKLTMPHYSGIGDHVIEFPGGTSENWKVGDKVNLYLGSPENPVKQTPFR